MQIKEIDLQYTAMLKLNGILDTESVDKISQRAKELLNQNRFKVIIDMAKVIMDNTGLVSLAAFLNDFKQTTGQIKLVSAGKNGFLKIELWKHPLEVSLSAPRSHYH